MDGTELRGARPSAAPMLKAPAKGKTGSGNPFWASPEGERWRGSRATRQRGGGQGCSVGARSGVGEERRAGEGLVRCGILRGSSGGFYRGRRRAPRRWGGVVEWPK
jgi:hypothetical protein